MDQKRKKEKTGSGVSLLVVLVVLLLFSSVYVIPSHVLLYLRLCSIFLAFVSFHSTLEQEKADDIRTRTKSIYSLGNAVSAYREGQQQIRDKVWFERKH